MVLVNLFSNRLKENGAKFAQIVPICAPKIEQPRRHETRVSKRNGTPIFAFEIPVGKTAT